MKRFSKQFHYIHRGFTLMEVMVAVSLFTVVVTIGIGSLMIVNTTYKKAQADRTAFDGMTYTLESMSRRLRTARTWGEFSNPPKFDIVDQDGCAVTYSLVNNPDTGNGNIIMNIDTCSIGPGGVYYLTPDDVNITGMDIRVMEKTNTLGTRTFKYAQLVITGKVIKGRSTSEFTFQTGVTKRSVQ